MRDGGGNSAGLAANPTEALQQAHSFGVTTVIDMWAARPALTRLKELEAEDRTDLAAVRTAGTGVTAPGGHPTQMDPMSARFTPTLAGPEQADAFVAERLAEGSDFIKIIYDNTNDAYGRDLPTLNEETISAAVRAAHARRRLAVAHIGNERYARGAIAAGVDGLAHLFGGPTVSADFGKFVKNSGAFVIPTLSVMRSICGKSDGPRILEDPSTRRRVNEQFVSVLSLGPPSPNLSCDGAMRAVCQLAEAGVTVLAGTDSPGPGTAYGASLHLELEHLVEAGMSPIAALAGATSATARVRYGRPRTDQTGNARRPSAGRRRSIQRHSGYAQDRLDLETRRLPVNSLGGRLQTNTSIKKFAMTRSLCRPTRSGCPVVVEQRSGP